MNNDLISREALKKAYFNAINETSIGEVSIISLIDNAPTVERPHVKWLPNYISQFTNPGRSCSLCNKTVEFSENFCPNCGADMRGE